MTGRASLLFATVLLLSFPASLSAQIPGQNPLNVYLRDRAGHARYVKRVTAEIDILLSGWADAWESREFRRLAGHYSDHVKMLQLPGRGEPLWPGTVPLETAFQRHLPRVRNARLSLVTADASRKLAYVSGRYEYELRESPGRQEVSGKFVFVFRQGDEGEWRVRSHLFRPESTEQ